MSYMRSPWVDRIDIRMPGVSYGKVYLGHVVKQQSESLQIEDQVASTTNEVSRHHFLERACAWTLELQLRASSFLIWSHAATTSPRVPGAINISLFSVHFID